LARSSASNIFHNYVLRFSTAWTLIGLIVIARVAYSGFLAPANIRNILDQKSPEAIIAVAMTFVIIGGAFDLSVAATLSLAGTVFADLTVHGFALAPAVILSLCVGMVVGACNGFVVTVFRVNSFIATLGSASIIAGLTLIFSNSTAIQPTSGNFGDIGLTSVAGVPVPIVILVVTVALGAVVLHQTVFGRSVFMIGGNSEASRLAGARVNLVRASTFVVAGLCAALAGIILASQTGVGQGSMDDPASLNAITMVVVGGTSLFGGEGAMWRTVAGILILGIIANLFESLAVSAGVQEVVTGGIVIVAVAVDAYARYRRTGGAR
jgi:ribose/xylose/arabinose/galactoside ABC-type transport system permease subunit